MNPVRTLVDSGPLVAVFSRTDDWHEVVRQWLQNHPTIALVTTWAVVTEVCALLARRVHNEAALDFLRWADRGGIEVDRPVEASLASVLQIAQRFADLPLDVADASIAEAAQRLRIEHVLSIDSDFDIYRNRQGRPLVNLLRA